MLLLLSHTIFEMMDTILGAVGGGVLSIGKALTRTLFFILQYVQFNAYFNVVNRAKLNVDEFSHNIKYLVSYLGS